MGFFRESYAFGGRLEERAVVEKTLEPKATELVMGRAMRSQSWEGEHPRQRNSLCEGREE